MNPEKQPEQQKSNSKTEAGSNVAMSLDVMSPSESPLSEAKKDSLEELIARDPLNLTDDEVDRLKIPMRERRAEWQKREAIAAQKKNGKKRPTRDVPVEGLKSGDLQFQKL